MYEINAIIYDGKTYRCEKTLEKYILKKLKGRNVVSYIGGLFCPGFPLGPSIPQVDWGLRGFCGLAHIIDNLLHWRKLVLHSKPIIYKNSHPGTKSTWLSEFFLLPENR